MIFDAAEKHQSQVPALRESGVSTLPKPSKPPRRQHMPDKKNYWTRQRPDGKWESKREGATRATRVTDTQSEAWAHSRAQAAESKGEAFFQGRDGKIRELHTYRKAPYPPKRTALIYDFDGTLARGNLQETSFIPEIGMTKKEFWAEVGKRTRDHDADEILVYMHLMLDKAVEAGEKVTAEDLRGHGEKAELFPGLAEKSWFGRINEHAAARGLALEHYIVSSGIHEMIEGCSIRGAFRQVFASKFIYVDGVAAWPGVGINYTTKTQYLFRINKGIDNHWNNKSLNSYMPEDERPIPFDRMIFLGDGDTDIPTMKMLTHKGGHPVAVYDPDRNDSDLKKIHKLISDGRVEFVAPADYDENSQIDIIVKGILGRIARKHGYRPAA